MIVKSGCELSIKTGSSKVPVRSVSGSVNMILRVYRPLGYFVVSMTESNNPLAALPEIGLT